MRFRLKQPEANAGALLLCEEIWCQCLLHAEICFVHQVQIMKSGSIDMVGLAGILYPLSKLMHLGSTIRHVSSSLSFFDLARSNGFTIAAHNAIGIHGSSEVHI